MSAPRWIVFGVLLAVTASYLGWAVTRQRTDRAALLEEIESTRRTVGALESGLDRMPLERDALRGLVETTLGSDRETVDASIRSALNQILQHHGLTSPSVSARAAVAEANPASRSRAREFRGRGRGFASFATITATASGVGTLQQVWGAVHTVQSQPWAHRVEFCAVEPDGKERQRFKLDLGVTTIFFPEEQVRPDPAAPLWRPPPDGGSDAIAGLLARSMFVRPPPDAPVAVAPPPDPAPEAGPAPAPPPYDQWRVTAIVLGRQGPELWLSNPATDARTRLGVGGTLLDVEFLGGTGETARIRIGSDVYEVALGKTLADRRIVGQ